MTRESNRQRRLSGRVPSPRHVPTGRLYAAIDLGTNNCRLLIAERGRSGILRVVESHSQIVRLGEGLAVTGRLSVEAMARARDALIRCADKIARHSPAQTRCIATQACRAAANGRSFIDQIAAETGLAMEIISPKEEAKFALLGCLDLIDPDADFALVIDIGGGSTELSWIDAKSARRHGVSGCARRPPILGWASFPLGVVTLADTVDAGAVDAYARMRETASAALSSHDAVARFGPLFRAGRGQLIGNSGTVTSLTGVQMGLHRYQRSVVDGAWLARDEAERTRDRLIEAGVAGRQAVPCLGPQRADLILPGCAILDAIWDLWPASRIRVGDRGLREGILLSMMHRGRPATAVRRGSPQMTGGVSQ